MPRRKKDEGLDVLECGCAHDGRRWHRMCQPHREEADELHRRAMEEYRRSRDTNEK